MRTGNSVNSARCAARKRLAPATISYPSLLGRTVRGWISPWVRRLAASSANLLSSKMLRGLVVDSWMRLRAMVWNPAVFFMGGSSVGCCTGRGVYIHAERLLAKVGGSNCKPRGLPTLVMQRSGMERAERSGGLHKRSAEDWGRGLSGARGEAPLRGFGCCFSGAALRARTDGMRRPVQLGVNGNDVLGVVL